MKKSNYNLWLAYHYGNINRKLTKKEYCEIRACEFAMHLLIPTEAVLEICGGLDSLKNMNIYHNYPVIKKLAQKFCVPEDVMLFKLDYLIKEKNLEESKNNVKTRILKKEGKIIFVDFD